MSMTFISQPPGLGSEAFTTSQLAHLEPFARLIDSEDSYWQACQFFLNGGWSEIIKQYFYESLDLPVLIFPGDELASQRIEPVPMTWSSGLRIGDMVLKTAWFRGLSPRLIYSQVDNSKNTVVKFVKKSLPMPMQINQPPTLECLDKSLLNTGVFSIDTRKTRGMPLGDFIGLVGKNEQFKDFLKIENIQSELTTQYVRVKLDTQSLVEILDVITYCLDAVWEWAGNNIMIAPGPGRGSSAQSWPQEKA